MSAAVDSGVAFGGMGIERKAAEKIQRKDQPTRKPKKSPPLLAIVQ